MTAEEIAAGLTEAQRKHILGAVEDNGRFFIRAWAAPDLTKREASQFRKLGLGFAVWSGFCLGKTGQAVRAILESNHDRA